MQKQGLFTDKSSNSEFVSKCYDNWDWQINFIYMQSYADFFPVYF